MRITDAELQRRFEMSTDARQSTRPEPFAHDAVVKIVDEKSPDNGKDAQVLSWHWKPIFTDPAKIDPNAGEWVYNVRVLYTGQERIFPAKALQKPG